MRWLLRNEKERRRGLDSLRCGNLAVGVKASVAATPGL